MTKISSKNKLKNQEIFFLSKLKVKEKNMWKTFAYEWMKYKTKNKKQWHKFKTKL